MKKSISDLIYSLVSMTIVTTVMVAFICILLPSLILFGLICIPLYIIGNADETEDK